MATAEAWVIIPKLDKDKTGCVLDMRPLVLCKDCIHHVDTVDDYDYKSKCPCFCSGDEYYSWVPDDDWFCPKGERRS